MAYRSEYENRRSNSVAAAPTLECALDSGEAVVKRYLWEPIEELRRRPSKHFRAQLLTLGWQAWRDHELPKHETFQALQEFIEDLHLGSLVVDDVQDDSVVRRGGPCLHRQIGSALAINAGNALYFKAFQKLENAQLPPAIELAIHRQAHATLIEAHEGQALDLALRAPDLRAEQILELCPHVSRLKTGALMALAVEIGARAAGATDNQQLQALRSIVNELGVTLQRFDDLGNMLPHFAGLKAYEDLAAGRLCWPWDVAARRGQLETLKTYVSHLPNTGPLQSFILENDSNFLRDAASRSFDLWQVALSKFVEGQISQPVDARIPYVFKLCSQLQGLAQKVSFSYGFQSFNSPTA